RPRRAARGRRRLHGSSATPRRLEPGSKHTPRPERGGDAVRIAIGNGPWIVERTGRHRRAFATARDQEQRTQTICYRPFFEESTSMTSAFESKLRRSALLAAVAL